MTRIGWLLLLASWAALIGGISIFSFNCDDSYIAFRYMDSWVAGDGLTWNPAPFPPVEGYTSFLWVILLGTVWKYTSLEPPQTANAILFLSSCGTLAWVTAIMMKLRLSVSLRESRVFFLGIVLFGTVSSRTFLIWSTSGLEQGFNTFLVLGWVYFMIWGERGWSWAVCGFAALLALTRPDGLLIWGLTGLIWMARARSLSVGQRSAGLLLGVPVVHLLWRFSTYGYWLPNTYYAKHAGFWPEAGAVYLSSFLTEYAIFLWLPLVWWARSSFRSITTVTGVVFAAIGGHFVYYTFGVGGDHFGYRVYHHLVPLMWLAVPILLSARPWPAQRARMVAIALVLSAQIIPWTHHLRTNDLDAVRARGSDPHTVSDVLPFGLSLWGMLWEVEQLYLRSHFVCIRYRAHRGFIERQRALYGEREDGIPRGVKGFPSIALSGVGYPGWVMPGALIVDKLGLNDPVVARNRAIKEYRSMAHDRQPPAGYVDCYRPNITANKGVIRVQKRRHPLTSAEVADCVDRFLLEVGH